MLILLLIYMQLLMEYGINFVVMQLMDEFDWLIFFLVNLDGYEYSYIMVNQIDIIFIIIFVSNYNIM